MQADYTVSLYLLSFTVTFFFLPSFLSFVTHISLCIVSLRPPDRKRRDVFGVANGTLVQGASRNFTGLEGNITDSELHDKEYPFSEGTVHTEFMEISNLQPFTVYRIDIHACNHKVQRCSAAAFVFSRTKPAGQQNPQT